MVSLPKPHRKKAVLDDRLDAFSLSLVSAAGRSVIKTARADIVGPAAADQPHASTNEMIRK
jgi:hypothetical protein